MPGAATADRSRIRGTANARPCPLGTEPVVLPECNRELPWTCDRELYKRRNEIERLFRRLTPTAACSPASTNSTRFTSAFVPRTCSGVAPAVLTDPSGISAVDTFYPRRSPWPLLGDGVHAYTCRSGSARIRDRIRSWMRPRAVEPEPPASVVTRAPVSKRVRQVLPRAQPEHTRCKVSFRGGACPPSVSLNGLSGKSRGATGTTALRSDHLEAVMNLRQLSRRVSPS